MNHLHRRSALCLLSGGLTALAGCSGSPSKTENNPSGNEDSIATSDRPPYANVLSDSAGTESFYGAIDVETMFELFDEETDDEEYAGETPESPLLANPLALAFLAWSGLYQLGNTPAFDAYLESDETPDGEGYVVYADGVYAVTGSYDVAEASRMLEELEYTAVEGGTGDEDGTRIDGGSGDDERPRVYEHDETTDIVGVTGDAFVFTYTSDGTAFDAHDAVVQTVRVIAGDTEPKHETDEAFDWLLQAGHNTGITCCWYSDDGVLPTADHETDVTDSTLEFDYEPFEGATAIHHGVKVIEDGLEQASTRTIVTAQSASAIDETDLESSLAGQAEAFDIVRDGSSMLIEADYGEL